MRLTLKLAAVLSALIVAVLAAEAQLRLNYERAEFIHDIERGHHLLGNALEPAIQLALAMSDNEAAHQILARAERSEREVSLRLVEPSTEDSPDGREATRIVGADPGAVVTEIPVRTPDGKRWTIELSESLAGVEARIATSARRIFIAALLSVVAAGVAAALVGDWLVGRPVRHLVEHTSQIAEGALPRPAGPRRRDEMGVLSDAMRAMVEGLDVARRRAQAEAQARDLAERELRRSERLATVGTLAAGLAHELGTPLQVISGRARGIQLDAGAGGDARRQAEIIRNQAARMERIVRQLLDFSRAPLDTPRKVEIAEILEESAMLMGPAAEARGSRIVLSKTMPQLTVHVDVVQLGQVFTNVLKNAIDAMPEGGTVSINAAVAEDEHGAPDHPGRRFVRVEIVDDGPGIDEEHLHHVCDPFFTTKPIGEGTGLGLSVAHGVVREHGGDLRVENAAPHGTRVTITLPETPS